MHTRRLAAIMFADIVGYTAMMQTDEALASKMREKHRQVLADGMAKFGGEIAQYYGDGALCLFSSAREAVLGAHHIQRALLDQPEVPHRIGIHIGDVVQDDSGVFGDGVNIASRIESLAIPGSVLLSDKVHHELANQPNIRTRSLGEFQLKNVKQPVEVYALDCDDIKVPLAGDLASQVAVRTAKSIAVIPFECMESQQEGAFFANGLSDEIAIGLSKVDGLSIIARTTCQAVKDSGEDPVKALHRLQVSHLLEGSVRSAGQEVRASVRLVNTTDGFQVWSEIFRGNLNDIFALQENIARHVVHALRINFNLQEDTEETVLEKHTTNPQAHQLFLKGLHHWNKRDPESVGKASDFFAKALEADSGYSSAQCGVSHCYAFLGSCGAIEPTKAYAKALDFAIKAIETDPANPEGHLAMANIKFYHYWDWEGTRVSLDKAASLGLNSGLLYQSYGLYYAATGDIARGIKKMEQALQLDPMSLPTLNMLGTLYLFNQEHERAIRIFHEVLDLDPLYRSALNYKGVALSCLKRHHEALEVFHQYHNMVNHPQKGITGLIIAYHDVGDHARASEYLNHLFERLKTEPTAAVEIDIAIALAGIGEFERAFDFLDRVYDKRFSMACMGMIWIIRCPHFKGLWQQPAFDILLSKMGLAKTA